MRNVRRHDAAGVAGVHALVQDVDAQRAADQAAQRGGDPQPLVVEAAGVEAQHEARRAEAVGERLEVGRQVGLPLSSLASISTTQRAWEPPAACAASIAAREANAA